MREVDGEDAAARPNASCDVNGLIAGSRGDVKYIVVRLEPNGIAHRRRCAMKPRPDQCLVTRPNRGLQRPVSPASTQNASRRWFEDRSWHAAPIRQIHSILMPVAAMIDLRREMSSAMCLATSARDPVTVVKPIASSR